MLQPRSRQRSRRWGEDWEKEGPSIGQRLDCSLEPSLLLNTGNTHLSTSTWRAAVVTEVRKEGDRLQDVKVHFDGSSPEDDRWISWRQERERLAPLGTGSGVDASTGGIAATVVATANGGTAAIGTGPSARGAGTSTDTPILETRTTTTTSSFVRGFSRTRMLGAMKIFKRANRPNGNSSGGGEANARAPAYDMGLIGGASSAGSTSAVGSAGEEYKEEEKEARGLDTVAEVGVGVGVEVVGGSTEAAVAAVAAEEAEEAEATANLAGEIARIQPIRELTPHLVEELEGEGGGFTLTVFRNNKQDVTPVPLVCGKFDTRYEADRAAEALSSPIWHEPSASSRCAVCDCKFRTGLQRRRHHCRNCGRLVCTTCAFWFWPKSKLPHTYRVDSTERLVRVCRTCFSAQKSFRLCLLTGCYREAMEAYNMGCVNLRTPYAAGELPVHCAAAGGNVRLLSWLVEDRCCPIFKDEEKTEPLTDAKGRSVMAAAADSGQVETMRYLAFTQPPTVMNVGGLSLRRGLQAYLRFDEDGGDGGGGGGGGGGGDGGRSCYSLDAKGDDEIVPVSAWRSTSPDGTDDNNTSLLQAFIGADGSSDAGYSIYRLPGNLSGGSDGDQGGRADRGGGRGSAIRGESACIVCFNAKVNCTLVPCGHYCCCMACMANVDLCPVCRIRITKRVKAIRA